ncbi:MAG: TetR/AcrR family transcriptional regulator [Mogibacterium sp.]|nr:TetR/AcrR family transcriptional regulator [Mogibacterium sp.]
MANDRRERIIGAAWKLFREKGFAEATINDIINEASISKGTFYYYFRSKDDLLDTLSEILDREYERLDGIEPQDLSCFDKLMWLNYEVHSFMEKNIDYRLLSYLYSAQIIKEDFSSLLNRNRYYYRYVERLMYEGQKNGELTDEMTVSEMVSFFSMGERALVTEWCMQNGSFSFGEYSRKLFPIMMQGLKKQ